MQAVMHNKEFLAALDRVRPAMNGRIPHVAGTHILLEAKGSIVSLTATDLETTITAHVAARVDEEGDICLLGSLLRDCVRNYSDDMITISPRDKSSGTGHDGLISAGRSKSNIAGINPIDFPVIQVPSDPDHSFTIQAPALRQLIQRTSFACLKDNARPILQGCQFKVEDKDIQVVATDGFRMARMTDKIAAPVGESLECVIPQGVVNDLHRLLRGVETPVKVTIDSRATFEIFEGTPGYAALSSQLIQGAYPDVARMIPQEFKTTIGLECELALNAVKMAGLFATGDSNTIRLAVDKESTDGDQGPWLQMSAQTHDVGELKNRIRVPSIDGEDNQIAFNTKFLTDVFAVLESPAAILQLQESKSAAMITIPDCDTYVYVLMPIFLD